jgi:ribosomal protein S2
MKFSTKYLMGMTSYLGHIKIYRSSSMDQFLVGYRSNMSIIDVHQTEFMLKRAINFFIDVIIGRGQALFISDIAKFKYMSEGEVNSSKLASQSFFGELYANSSSWIDGSITNFRQLKHLLKGVKTRVDVKSRFKKKQIRYLPSVMVLLEEVRSKYFILNEGFKKRIPTIALIDSDMIPSMACYPIPSGNDISNLINFYRRLFSKALEVACQRQRLLYIGRKQEKYKSEYKFGLRSGRRDL